MIGVSGLTTFALKTWARVTAISVLAMAWPVAAADWPMLGRDHTRNPVSSETNPPIDWDVQAGRNIKWKAPLGFYTFGDPVVSDGLVWVGSGSRDHGSPAAVLYCFRERDGELLFQHRTANTPGRIRTTAHVGVSCSPLVENDRLWFTTILGEVICLDIAPLLQGRGDPVELWKVDLLEEYGVFPGIAYMGDAKSASVASFGNRIYVMTGNGADHSRVNVPSPFSPGLLCLNKETGELIWEDDPPPGAGLIFDWGSPLILEIDGQVQAVAPQGDGWIRSFDALTGELLWKFDINPKASNQPNHFLNSPVFHGDRIFIAGGREMEHGGNPGRLVCINPARRGDISLELNDGKGRGTPNPNAGADWHYDEMDGSRSNVAIDAGLLIAADFRGVVHCLDVQTGEVLWKHDTGERIFGSPLIVDGKVYVTTGWQGQVFIFELAREKRLLARHAMGGYIHSSPVFANGTLYVAAGETLYAIKETPPANDWPQWRGADRSNFSRETGLLEQWPEEGPPLAWTASGLGDEIASVAIQEGRLVTLGRHAKTEYALALDAATGQMLWATALGPTTSRSSPMMRWLSARTPTMDGERVYAISTEGELACLNAENGAVLWRKSYQADFQAPLPIWGFCDYPLVDGNRLIIAPGGSQASAAALNKHTGEVLWQAAVPAGTPAGYGASILMEAAGIRQYVVPLDQVIAGLDPIEGRVLWTHHAPRTFHNSYTPVLHAGRLLAPHGYGNLLTALEFKPQPGDGLQMREAYSMSVVLDPFQDSTVLIGDHLYIWKRAQGPACIDPRTGNEVWSGPQMGDLRGRAAMTGADGHLYYILSNGELLLVEATPEAYRPKSRFRIPAYAQSVGASFPVVAGGRLYIRDNDRLLCYDVRQGAPQQPVPSPGEIRISIATPALESGSPAVEQPARGLSKGADAIYVPTPGDVVARMLEMAGVKKTDLVVDLGSGDGRIVIAAARTYGSRSIGYEIDTRLVELSRRNVASEKLDALARIAHEDIFSLDFSEADVVAVYLPAPLLERLLPQFRTLKPGARIVSHQFAIPGVPPDQTFEMSSSETGDTHRILLWAAPLKEAQP
jgi:outer membrane protein assembly factor BamB